MELNQKLSELRKGRGLTQQELAEALNVSRQTVSRWEVGTAAPTLDNLAYLSRLYGVPLDDFIREEREGVAEVPEVPENVVVPIAAPPDAGRPRAGLALPLFFLAVLILGVGILIGMNLPREKSTGFESNFRVEVDGPRGWLERTPTDIEDELQWLETTVRDLLEEDQPLP